MEKLLTALPNDECNGEPPNKAVTFLTAKNTTHTNQENSAPLSFNFDVIF